MTSRPGEDDAPFGFPTDLTAAVHAELDQRNDLLEELAGVGERRSALSRERTALGGRDTGARPPAPAPGTDARANLDRALQEISRLEQRLDTMKRSLNETGR